MSDDCAPLNVPLTISPENFGAALRFLGIPVDGAGLMALDWEPGRLTVVYKRSDANGRTVIAGKAPAKQRFDIGIPGHAVFPVAIDVQSLTDGEGTR